LSISCAQQISGTADEDVTTMRLINGPEDSWNNNIVKGKGKKKQRVRKGGIYQIKVKQEAEAEFYASQI